MVTLTFVSVPTSTSHSEGSQNVQGPVNKYESQGTVSLPTQSSKIPDTKGNTFTVTWYTRGTHSPTNPNPTNTGVVLDLSADINRTVPTVSGRLWNFLNLDYVSTYLCNFCLRRWSLKMSLVCPLYGLTSSGPPFNMSRPGLVSRVTGESTVT